MNRHDLTLEELGYTHARLNQPARTAHPPYQQGYQQGTSDRLHWGHILDQYFQNFHRRRTD
jgi:hypothetical protein